MILTNFLSLRIGCAFVLGTALQNNPKIQQLVAQYNGLQLVLEAIEFELKNPSYYSLVILGIYKKILRKF